MSWDIYGNPLQRGHCEVHPHVHEEYPCSVCVSYKGPNEEPGCDGNCESAYFLAQLQDAYNQTHKTKLELLEALEVAVQSMLDSGYAADSVAIRASRAAINKAKGEP